MGEADELRQAIAASGLSARSFAAFLEVDERTVRKWIAEDRAVPGPVAVICRAIIRDPAIVASLAPPPEDEFEPVLRAFSGLARRHRLEGEK